MQIQLQLQGRQYVASLLNPLDISTPIQERGHHPLAFHAPYVAFEPVVMGTFIGSTLAGSPVNFKNIRLNPHGNGTHTECIGHISTEGETIHSTLTHFHFSAELLSVYPTKLESGDSIIDAFHFETLGIQEGIQAIIIRTLPNHSDKLERNWSGTNPTYCTPAAIEYLVNKGIEHLIIDLPSIDREEDAGAVAAHKMWWQFGKPNVRKHCTITELAYIPDHIPDGLYLLNLQICSLQLDASPSKPVLYALSPLAAY